MSGRFDPTPQADQQALARIESAITALVDSLQSLALPIPQVSVQAPSLPNIDVTVPTEGLVDAVVRAVNEAVAAMPRPEAQSPSPGVGPTEAVLADGSLTPLVEAAQEQRAVLQALQEKLTNVMAGGRSHFDGRLRTDSGPVSASNPLPATEGAYLGKTYDYDAGTGSATVSVPDGAVVLTLAASASGSSATVTVGGGAVATIPADTTWRAEPKTTLVGPLDVVIVGSDAYFVDWAV